jgi:16S rRNA (guanine1207-N2)-methyltransferase
MTAFITETLMFPYRKNLIERPAADARLLFLNAEDPALLKDIVSPTLIQSRFDKALPLIEAGYKVTDKPNGKFDTVWILPSKDREETQYLLAQAVRASAKDGLILAAAPNDAGGKRLEGLFEELGLSPHVESKNKGRVVFATVDEGYNHEQADKWFAQGQEQLILSSALVSRPGLYGWDKVDEGSALLARHLPSDLSGSIADFGCGWGYLSLQATAVSKKITSLTLVDIDSRAVDIARRNVQSRHPDLHVEKLWTDLAYSNTKLGLFDVILLNPPFHAGTQAVPALGQAIITAAAQALKPTGKLYLVANRHLPYEKKLEALFKQANVLEDAGGFKAFVCHRS